MDILSLAGTPDSVCRSRNIICEATQADIPWLLELAKDCYPAFDVASSEKWLRNWIGKENIIAVKGEEAAALASLNRQFWMPNEIECELQFVCSKRTRFGAVELIKVLKKIDELRKQRNCSKFYLNSRLADLEPIANRLGARLIGKSFVLEG